MSKLRQLLSYLDRPGITELAFRTGAPAQMRSGTRQHPLTVAPLGAAQIGRFFEGTEVLAPLPARGDLPTTTRTLTLLGRAYSVTVGGSRTAFEVRLSPAADGSEQTGAATRKLEAIDEEASGPILLPPRDDPTGDGESSGRHSLRGDGESSGNYAHRGGESSGRRSLRGDGESSGVYSQRGASESSGLRSPRGDGESSGVYSQRGASESSGLRSPRGDGESSGVYSHPGTSESSGLRSPRGDGEASGVRGHRREPSGPRSTRADGESSGVYAHRGREPSAPRSVRNEGESSGVHPRGSREPSGPRSMRGASEPSGLHPPREHAPSAAGDGLVIERNEDVHGHATARDQPAVDPRAIPLPDDSGAPISLSSPAPAPGPPPIASPAPSRPPTAVAGPPPRNRPAQLPTHQGLQQIVGHARRRGASDVHLMAGAPVRVRHGGALEPVGPPLSTNELEAMARSLLQPRHTQQLEQLGYADLAADIPDAGRLRININRQRTGLKICIRLVASTPPSMNDLGLPMEVGGLTGHHQGLVVISGPNGHGKTTTMSALVDLFNATKSVHIITVEDPVEVLHPRKRALVTQREVGLHTRSFQTALEAALREDPDVIAIGELRDRETTEMALSASETGHLVLATMSTPSGAKTIDRVIDMFPPDEQSQVRATMAGALKLVLSQRLLPRADGQGMVAAYEMITGNIPLWSLIRDNKLFQLTSLLQRGRAYGMLRLEDSLRELVQRGAITREQALLHADDPRALNPPPATPTPTPNKGGLFGRGR